MRGLGFSVSGSVKNLTSQAQSTVNQAQNIASQAQDIANQAQYAAEQAQQIAQSAQTIASGPPVPRPPSLPVVQKPAAVSFNDTMKTYAIPILAVSLLIGVGIFVMRAKQ